MEVVKITIHEISGVRPNIVFRIWICSVYIEVSVLNGLEFENLSFVKQWKRNVYNTAKKLTGQRIPVYGSQMPCNLLLFKVPESEKQFKILNPGSDF